MISNSQVDELERLIVFSTMDNLPLVLSRAIPLLFSELRLVRATLDSKVGDFLGGIGNADDRRTEVDQGAASEGLPSRHEPLADRQEVQAPSKPEGDTPVARGLGQESGGGEGGKRRRGRPKKDRSAGIVDTGASQPQVGGPVAPEVGDDSLLGIEAPSRLKGNY